MGICSKIEKDTRSIYHLLMKDRVVGVIPEGG